MIARGRFISFFYKDISKNIFVGKKVKLYEKRYLSIGDKTKIHDYSKIDSLSEDSVRIGSKVVLRKIQ